MSTNSENSEQKLSSFWKNYLIAYNIIQTLGWSYLLLQLITYYISSPNCDLYNYVKWPLIIFQNAAVLEIFHAHFKLVRSNPTVTLQQVFSRVMVVCGVLVATVQGRDYYGLPLALLAWCITEIIRYSFYAFNLLNCVPHFILWLRYTTFIVLYPIGITGELLCLYGAFREVTATKLWTVDLPNVVNFSFQYNYFILMIMLLYIPLFPQLYLHMFSQRKKSLRKEETDGKARFDRKLK